MLSRWAKGDEKVILEKKGGLKVKIRNLLAFVAMLSVFIIGIGTAHAVFGVNDDVAGQDIVVPLICGNCGADTICGNGDDSSGLNTLIAIAEVKAGEKLLTGDYPKTDDNKTPKVCMDWDLRNRTSCTVLTSRHCWSAWDIEGFDCKTLTKNIGTSMEVVIDGVKYNTGYIIYRQTVAADDINNKFIAWQYLVDLTKGFASGFNGLQMEGGVGSANLGEDGGNAPITAHDFFPRYYINNNDPDSWTWWIILAGRNEVGIYGNGTSCGNICPAALLTRILFGNLCNEAENCIDFGIEIPYEMNIISVGDIPQLGAIWPDPTVVRKGWATVGIREEGDTTVGAHILTEGTINPDDNICGLNGGELYSIFGYSYQRAKSNDPSSTGFNLSWDVVHPMHRVYCSNSAAGIEGAECTSETNSP